MTNPITSHNAVTQTGTLDFSRSFAAEDTGASKNGSVPVDSSFQVNDKALVSDSELDAALAELNNQLERRKSNLSFSKDPSTGSHIVRVVNSSTGEVVRQLPSAEILQFKRNLHSMIGLIFDKRT
jgi:flagellar protein FlaG